MHGQRPRRAVVDTEAPVVDGVEVDGDHGADGGGLLGCGRALHVHGVDLAGGQAVEAEDRQVAAAARAPSPPRRSVGTSTKSHVVEGQAAEAERVLVAVQ